QSHESSLLLFTESGVEAAGGSESSGPAVAVVKCFDEVEVGVCDPLDHQLGDAITAGHTQRGLRVEVDQRNPDLATGAGIDSARRVDDGDPVRARQTRPREDEGREA